MILVNGEKLSSINPGDRAFQYGDGLFETIAVYKEALLAFDLHLHRLKEGCSRLGIPCPSEDLLYSECSSLAHGQHKAVIKLIVSRGEGGRGYLPPSQAVPSRVVMLFPWPDYPSSHASEGVVAGICEGRLSCNAALAGIKHLNRLEQVLLRKEIGERYVEALVMDTRGQVIEGIMSNVFIARGDLLFTPSLQHSGVNGVIRSAILELAGSMDLAVQAQDISLDDVLNADELFFCNSLIGIWPVRELPGRKYEQLEIARSVLRLLQDNVLVVK